MPVYLDHNATTPLNPMVLEAMKPYLSGIYGNPSSVHRFGRLTRDALEQARLQVACTVGAEPNQIIFTSGGTEANNLAIKGVLENLPFSRFAVSAIEHASLLEPSRLMAKKGWQLDMIPVNNQGQVEVEKLLSCISSETKLVSVMAANNETGVVQDIKALVDSAKTISSDLLFHSDACQLVGKLPVNFAELKLDLMSLSSHKLYGPQGVGALVVNRSVDLMPQLIGGGQEKQRRSGTENLAAIVGFGMAAELAVENMQSRYQHTAELQRQLIAQLTMMQGVEVFSRDVKKIPNTVQFSIDRIDGEALLMQLDKKGFAVSSGSACGSGNAEPSHVLLAMSVPENTAKGAIRVSFGEQNTSKEVTQFIEALENIKQY